MKSSANWRTPVVLLALLASAIAGCSDRNQTAIPDGIVEYTIEVGGKSVGVLRWIPVGAARFLGGDGVHRPVHLYAVDSDVGEKSVTYLAVNPWGVDEGSVGRCLIGHHCATTSVDWMTAPVASVYFGHPILDAFLPSNGDTVTLTTDSWSRQFQIERLGSDLLQAKPTGDSLERLSQTCNILDDEVVINIRTRMVQSCKDSAGFAYRYRSGIPKAFVASDHLSLFRLTPLFRNTASIPPESEYSANREISLKETFDAARNLSSEFRSFLETHPEAAVEDFGQFARTRGTDTLGERIHDKGRLRMVASESSGFEISVDREITYVAGQPVGTTYAVSAQRTFTPTEGHRWERMKPLPEFMAPLGGSAHALGSMFGNLTSANVMNIAQHGEPGPRLGYVFWFDESCAHSTESCEGFSTAYALINSTAARLEHAELGSAYQAMVLSLPY